MKKWFMAILLIGVSFFSVETSAKAEEKVIWDGAEVVKDQSGKMTFTKDVKVYKKDSSGKFVSMVVKKGNYLRVYDVENYDGKVYYWMSGGYRVQSTNLVVFKDVPMNLRVSFFKDPVWIVTSEKGILHRQNVPLRTKGMLLKDFSEDVGYFAAFQKYTIVNGKLHGELYHSGEGEYAGYTIKEFISGSDVKVVEDIYN